MVPHLAAPNSLRSSSRRYTAEPRPSAGSLTSLALLEPQAGVLPACGGDTACSCGGGGAAKAEGGGEAACACSSAANPVYLYMIGGITTSFPSLSVEKELYQTLDTVPASITPALLFSVLSKGDNLYLAREMCWTIDKDGVSVYVLRPRTENELVSMIRAIAPRPDVDYDVVVGTIGTVSSADSCNGLDLPTVMCDEAFDFTSTQYIAAIAAAIGTTDLASVGAVFYTVMQMADNTGNTDAFRAVNFLVVRCLQVYVTTYNLSKNLVPPFADPKGFVLNSVSIAPSPVQGSEKILDVIFSYLGASTSVLVQFFCRVDVSGEFPFLVLSMVEYYRHP